MFEVIVSIRGGGRRGPSRRKPPRSSGQKSPWNVRSYRAPRSRVPVRARGRRSRDPRDRLFASRRRSRILHLDERDRRFRQRPVMEAHGVPGVTIPGSRVPQTNGVRYSTYPVTDRVRLSSIHARARAVFGHRSSTMDASPVHRSYSDSARARVGLRRRCRSPGRREASRRQGGPERIS